jgi:phosphocarrier protein FPr/phosphocarrier protein
MAGDPRQALLLVGLGIGELSMAPASISAVKEALAAYALDELRAVAERAVAATTLAEVRQIVADSFPAVA